MTKKSVPKNIEFAVYELSDKRLLKLPKITFEELITSYQFKLLF